ncbi:hypothetical protein BD408DRAFT_435511 [Parasitella parasitica]|nr:hypothetical protein BD408DRAFT_435511 [Parasitella parasitica]
MSIIPPKLPKPYATIKDYKIPDSLRQALELPSYLFTGELQNWVKMSELLDAYFEASLVIAKNGHALLTTASIFLKKIRENKEALYALKEVEWREKRSESSLNSETRIASNRIITKRVQEVGEGSTNKEPNKKQKIDKLFDEEDDEISHLIPPTALCHTKDDSAAESAKSDDGDDDVFSTIDEACLRNDCSEDLSVVRYYFDICVSTCESEASDETKAEYEAMMQEQNNLQSLKNLGSDIMDWVAKILNWSEKDMFKNLGTVPDLPFLNFVKFTIVDFLLNCMRTHVYNQNDERTAYCELFIPIFKAFGNTTKKLNYVWCEKKVKDSDYVWLVSNNFVKDKGCLKLLDGIGRLVDKELNYILIESSGFNKSNALSHSLNDTLKNMKSGSDNLKCFVSNYKKASFIRYKIKSASQWQVVECRSACIPLSFSGIIHYTKVFELFAFLLSDMAEQDKIFHQLEMESLGLIEVPQDETVAHFLM